MAKGLHAAFFTDGDAALAARDRQAQQAARKTTKRERRQARFNEQVRQSGVVIKQLLPGPAWHKKTKRQVRAEEVGRLRDEVHRLEAQVNRMRHVQNNVKFYDSPDWHRVRYVALRRSNGCCELCGASKATGTVIQVDHIKPRSKFPELELDANNLQVLCKPCNMGKSNRDSIDWRKPELKVVRGS